MKIPTRFWIAVMIFFTTYINYTTRVNLSISIISMVQHRANILKPECLRNTTSDGNTTEKAELPDYGTRYNWDEEIQGILLGSYFYGYVISSFPAGMVAEWIGPFHTLFWCGVIALISNTLSVFAAKIHWGALLATRFVLGFLAGFIYPALQVLIALWAPPNEKGKFFGALLGNTFGTFLTWSLVGLITQKTKWDYGFYFVSIQIALYCVAFWFVVADSPLKHTWISDEEKDYILTSQAGTVKQAKRIPPYGKMFCSCPFWALAGCHFGNEWGLYFQITAVPKYLAEVLGFPLMTSGVLAALPHITRFFCGNIFGFTVDYLFRNELMTKTTARKFFLLFSHILPGLLLICLTFFKCGQEIAILACIILSMGLNGAAAVTNLVNPQDLAPNFAGTIYGFNGTTGGTTGFIAATVTAYFIKDHNGIREWGWAFILGGTVYIAGAVIFIVFGSAELQPWNEVN